VKAAMAPVVRPHRSYEVKVAVLDQKQSVSPASGPYFLWGMLSEIAVSVERSIWAAWGRVDLLGAQANRVLQSVFIGGRKDRASGAWALFGGEMGCRSFLRCCQAK
jgi:hypothetical protein